MRHLKDRLTVEEVYDTWINGNITDAKLHIKRMNKSEFLRFISHVQTHSPDWFSTFLAVQKLVD